MALTPDEIRATSFSTLKKGGFDPDEVAEFQSRAAHEIESLEMRLNDAVERVTMAEEEIEAMQRDADEASRVGSMTAAAAGIGNRVDELLAAAERSAQAIVRDAQAYAASKRSEADTYASQVRTQVEELRRTTEEQAETFRQETVTYAGRIRAEAEAAAEAARAQAEAESQATHERLMTEATERLEAARVAEVELLQIVKASAEDLGRAHDRFGDAVSRHETELADGPYERPGFDFHTEPSKAPTMDSPIEVDDLAFGSQPDSEAADDALAADTAAWADDVADEATSSWISGGAEDADETGGVDGWPAEETSDVATASWAAPEETSADVTTEHSDSWTVNSDSWTAPEVTSTGEDTGTDGSWAALSDSWNAPDAAGSDSSHSPDWGQGEGTAFGMGDAWINDDSSWDSEDVHEPWNSGDEENESEGDPLAAMVREAVERLTDGEGTN